jgi:hypothetical protein
MRAYHSGAQRGDPSSDDRTGTQLPAFDLMVRLKITVKFQGQLLDFRRANLGTPAP